MTADLEELIRKRQDQLRGRPEDWIDRFMQQRKDRLKIVAVIVLLIILICAWIAW
jgi:hypothetical protein